MSEVAHVLEVPDEQWVFEIVLGPELGDKGGRTWPLAALACQGIPRQGEDHGEDQERRTKDDRDHLE